jgi:MarR family transcriptional regulator, organic hydroperoxide resistance regulator
MFDHCLYFNSSALARLVEREWTTAYAPFGLTPAQGFVLRVVLRQPGCLASDVAAVLGIARPTATRLVDTLCEKQLLERRQGEADAREWGLFPTAEGEAIDVPINAASAEVARTLREKVGSDLFETTVAGMRDIRKGLA